MPLSASNGFYFPLVSVEKGGNHKWMNNSLAWWGLCCAIWNMGHNIHSKGTLSLCFYCERKMLQHSKTKTTPVYVTLLYVNPCC